MYGFTEMIATNAALTEIRNRRPFIVSRSSFPGHGHYGAHWTGDVLSDWGSMRQSIAGENVFLPFPFFLSFFLSFFLFCLFVSFLLSFFLS
jgi:hypothetical protein